MKHIVDLGLLDSSESMKETLRVGTNIVNDICVDSMRLKLMSLFIRSMTYTPSYRSEVR